MPAAFANLNDLWAATLVEALFRKGLTTAVTCPGSRSSPLTFAFARHPEIEAISVLDERSAGFFALGIARRSGLPVALVCTSGSAVANFFPAVVEASESGTPLLLLTADRPPELRDCSAGQTIDQTKLFGGYVRKQMELAVAENSLPLLRHLRQTVGSHFDRALGPDSGPVHLNIPLRDPLAPVAVDDFEPALSSDGFASFFSEANPPRSASVTSMALDADHFAVERGLILVGPEAPVGEERWLDNLARIADSLGWPLLSDALNPTRSHAARFANLICGYDFILRSKEARSELRPDRILVVGEFPTSKVLREWVSSLDIPITLVGKRLRNADPTHSRSTALLFDLETGEIEGTSRVRPDGSFLASWKSADSVVRNSLQKRMTNESGMFEGKLAWMLSSCLPKGSDLCVSNSMPPRDMEFYFAPNARGIRVRGSRGANGIDGILSTAIGVAHRGRPTYLLTGDLALLHDSNGALLAKSLFGSLTILLVNNSGGGIFEMLPVSSFSDVFEKHFATDQEIDFSNWARTYGIAHRLVESWNEMKEELAAESSGIRILEIRTDRKADSALRRKWFSEISELLSKLPAS